MALASTLQFVDAVSGSPAVRLDLNSDAVGGLQVMRDGWDVSPPPLRRATASTLLADGEAIPAAAYGNRVIGMKLRLLYGTEAQKRTALSNLGRELDRDTNTLKVQLAGASGPTFYRVLRSPDFGVRRFYPGKGGRLLEIELALLAEPFGIGLPTTVSPVTVTNNPAAGSNGCFWDVTGVTGDVETPALLLLDPVSGAFAPIISTRRRGTPSSDIQPFVQAESGTMGTNTAVQNPVTGFSNGQGARVSYANNNWATRLTVSVPYTTGFPRAGARGTYRLWAAVQPSSSTASYDLQYAVYAFFGGTALVSGPVRRITGTTSRVLVDLGLLQVPVGADPDGAGYGAPPALQSVSVAIDSRRAVGASGTLDIDYVFAMPADAEYSRLGASQFPVTLDGPQDAVYLINTTNGGIASDGDTIPGREGGGIPMLSPNQTNRIYLLRPSGPGVTTYTDTDVITATTSATLTWWPRYLVAAP